MDKPEEKREPQPKPLTAADRNAYRRMIEEAMKGERDLHDEAVRNRRTERTG